MNRKEFLSKLFSQIIKPIVGIIALGCIIYFFIAVFKDNGPEQFVSLLVLGLAAFIIILSLIGSVLRSATAALYNALPAKLQLYTNVLGRILNLSLPLFAGALAYISWQKSPEITLFYLIYIGLNYLPKIYAEEKQKFQKT